MKTIPVPADMLYSFNKMMSDRRGVLKKILMVVSGGLGDVVCAEPSVRYAAEKFHDSEISVLTDYPDLFQHIPRLEVLDAKTQTPDHNDYFVHHSMVPASHVQWEFLSPMCLHCVDYASISFFKMQLPVAYREIKLPDFYIENKEVAEILAKPEDYLIIHAGKGYQTKTFPASWWDDVMLQIKSNTGFKIVLVGKTVDREMNATPFPSGYVDTQTEVHYDLREKLSLKELVMLLKGCKYLLSNDSSPVHIAAAGGAHIGMIATLKHSDYISHWRSEIFGHYTHNFSNGYAQDHINFQQNQMEKVELYEMPEEILLKLLPEPSKIGTFYQREWLSNGNN